MADPVYVDRLGHPLAVGAWVLFTTGNSLHFGRVVEYRETWSGDPGVLVVSAFPGMGDYHPRTHARCDETVVVRADQVPERDRRLLAKYGEETP